MSLPFTAGWFRSPCCALALLSFCLSPVKARAEDPAETEKRLLESVKYLASDELEGRGIGTKGLNAAADYIAAQFKSLGLKTDLIDGGPFQKFPFIAGAELGKVNEVFFSGPSNPGSGELDKLPMKIGEDFNPLALGGSGKFDLPLVFAGYGITAKEASYDDYAGLDVKGKAVILLRHEPQQDNPHSEFNGTQTSEHAPYSRKISNAYEHGAAAIVFCTDDFDLQKALLGRKKRYQDAVAALNKDAEGFNGLERPTLDQLKSHKKKSDELTAAVNLAGDRLIKDYDALLPFNAAGTDSNGRDIPVLFMKRAALDQVLKAALKTDLASLEKEIDAASAPQSAELPGWKVAGEVSIDRQTVEVKNVIGVLEGEGPLANETIVVGAHYDHVGRGGPGSGSLDPTTTDIHNGADDNGSGTAALLEVARRITQAEKKPRRRIVFMAFTAEERGLIGSAQYCKSPLFKLEDTVAMVNLDMVGRLTDDKLIIEGSGTAKEFNSLIDKLNEKHGFKITKKPGGFGPSDQASFYSKKIPVVFFFTGTHKDYHRPSDDYDKLNIPGMRRITEMAADISLHLAEMPDRPAYVSVASGRPAGGGGRGDRPYFGSIPDFANDKPGLALSGVSKDGPAEKAGLKAGDVIVKLGPSKIGNLEDFDSALRKFKAGDKVPVIVQREGKDVTVEVLLEPAR